MLELSLPYVTSTTTGGCAYWLPAAGGGLVASAAGRASLRARYVTVTPAVTALPAVTPTVTPTANWSEGLHCAHVSSIEQPDRRLAARARYTQRTYVT